MLSNSDSEYHLMLKEMRGCQKRAAIMSFALSVHEHPWHCPWHAEVPLPYSEAFFKSCSIMLLLRRSPSTAIPAPCTGMGPYRSYATVSAFQFTSVSNTWLSHVPLPRPKAGQHYLLHSWLHATLVDPLMQPAFHQLRYLRYILQPRPRAN